MVDPTDHNRIYKPGLTLTVSTDGGRSFSSGLASFGGSTVHPDHHGLWIDPDDPAHLILGTDGGVYVSADRGASFRHVGSIPISQFYRVSYDMDFPYNVYGGLQDNGAWAGPTRSLGGVKSRDWDTIGFGDGFWVLRDPSDPRYVYYDWQRGNILRVDLETREARDVKPHPGRGEPSYRWHWNTPLHFSPNEPGTIYAGAQYLFRSRDRGESWQRISPDLTRGEPPREAAETDDREATVYDIAFGCIFFLSESPADGTVIWAGTDDGNLQVTRDSGETWSEVSGNLPEAPELRWISSVVASPHDSATAFATVQGHRSGNPGPLLYVTDDHGATWRSLVGDGVEGLAHIVRQDPVRPDLLYLGTEFGLFISVDGGENWARFSGNLPKVAVRDLVADPRSPHTGEDRALQQRVSLRLYDRLTDLTYVVESLSAARDQARERTDGLREKDRLRRRLEELADSLDAQVSGLVSSESGPPSLAEEKLREKMADLYSNVIGYTGRPTRTQLDRLEAYEAELADAMERFEAFRPEIAEIKAMLERKGLEALRLMTREEWEAEQER